MSQMKELTRCPRCNRMLVGQEEVHAYRGQLYCSKNCAVQDITDDYIQNAKEMAIEAYDSEAEIVSATDVLKEDLLAIKITVSCTRIINVPANLPKDEAIKEAAQLYNDGLVPVEPDDCDDMSVTYELVKEENSECEEA